jgi:threonine dehydratase
MSLSEQQTMSHIEGVTLKSIVEAQQRILGGVKRTPCVQSRHLSTDETKVSLKLENLQYSGSFKDRGVLNKILLMKASSNAHGGIIAASPGNHGLSVAYQGNRQAVKVTLVMPEYTPICRINRAKELGAEVIVHGSKLTQSIRQAKSLAKTQNLVFIDRNECPDVISGYGTLALELLEQMPDITTVVVPLGGGCLAAGIALVLKEKRPEVRLVGVESQSFPSMNVSLERGQPMGLPRGLTVADGILVDSVSHLSFEVIKERIDEVMTVSEDALCKAILLLAENEKTLVEGAGAAAVAAVMAGKVKGAHICCLLTGGNLDVNVFPRILERGLRAEGRLTRLEVALPDTPGSLAKLTSLVGSKHGNVLQTHLDRTYAQISSHDTTVDLLIETGGIEHRDTLLRALEGAGYTIISHKSEKGRSIY